MENAERKERSRHRNNHAFVRCRDNFYRVWYSRSHHRVGPDMLQRLIVTTR